MSHDARRTSAERFALYLVAMVVPLLLIGGLAMWQNERVAGSGSQVQRELISELRSISATRDSLLRVQLVAEEGTNEGPATAAYHYRGAAAAVEWRFAWLDAWLDAPQERTPAGAAGALWRSGDRAFRAWATTGERNPRGADRALRQLRRSVTGAMELLASARDNGLREIQGEASAIRRRERRDFAVLVGLSVGALILAFVLAQHLYRFVRDPLDDLRRAARRVAEDDLSQRVSVQREDEFGEVAHAFNAMMDRLVESRDQLTNQAFRDELTGLANRTLFRERTAHALKLAGGRDRDDRVPTVVMLDLDGFEVVNQVRGHATGDALLVAVGKRLQLELRPEDTVARLGGDEFAALLETSSDPDEPVRIAKRMLRALRKPFTVEGVTLRVQASVGVAIWDGKPIDEFLRDANAALGQAKRRGGNALELFDEAMRTEVLDRLALDADLAEAIKREQFDLHLQPIVDLETGRVVCVEALLRWEHPARGGVPPAEFIPRAEHTGQIVPIGRWVLHQACVYAKRLQSHGRNEPPIAVCVNVSLRQLQDPRLVVDVQHALTHAQLEPSALVIEITEETAARDMKATVERITALRELGVKVALDDFGTGYSSLNHLQSFPLDYLKIDRSFVAPTTERDVMVLRAMIELGRTLGLVTVAEGIEQPEQAAIVREVGGQLGQGYLFAHPGPVERLEKVVSRSGAKTLAHALHSLG